MRKVCLSILACATLSGLWILHAQEAPKPTNMGGVVTGGFVTPLPEGPKASIAHFRFDPGARTKWHSHEAGQIVLVEEGIGRTQVKGGPVIELHANDTIYCPPGVVHWHGAGPDKGGVQFNISRGGITWLAEV